MCCSKMWGLVVFVVLFITVEILAEAAFFQLVRWKSCLPKRNNKAPREGLLWRQKKQLGGWEISLSSIFPISCSNLHELFRELMDISVWDSGDREVKKSEMESQPQRGRGKGCPRWSDMNKSLVSLDVVYQLWWGSTSHNLFFSSEKWDYNGITCRKGSCKTMLPYKLRAVTWGNYHIPLLILKGTGGGLCLLWCMYVEEQTQWLWVWSSAIIWLDEIQCHVQVVLNSASWEQCTRDNPAWPFHGQMATRAVLREHLLNPGCERLLVPEMAGQPWNPLIFCRDADSSGWWGLRHI